MIMNKKQICALFDFAWFPSYEGSIEYLAVNLADAEDWEFSDIKVRKYSILKNYLEHTFRRVKQENKVKYTQTNSHACFNTGLVTKNLEAIYAFFEENRRNFSGQGSSPFCFKAFLKESDSQLLRVFPGNLPETANYFQKPEDLIFNPGCNLIPQIDHILEDNIGRFPAHMTGLDNNEIRRRLEGAINEAKKKVKTNYKIAVPHFL